MNDEDKQAVIRLIATIRLITGKADECLTIEKVQKSDFFKSYNNLFDGYYVWVNYLDRTREIWFAVDLRYVADDDWFVEKITSI